MNKPLRKVGLVMLVMIALLLANTSWVQVVHSEHYADNPRNLRVLYDKYSRKRGQIVSAENGVSLADSKASDDKFNYRRTYPFGPEYGPVIGYQSLRYGTSGIEREMNDFLNGSGSKLFTRRLADLFSGRKTEGGNVRLTIRHKLQEAAYKAMTERDYTGAAVAMNPKTGEVLAMVSTPSFDPQPLASHNSDKQEKAWKSYRDNDSNPLANRAASEVYPPGSTFKLVVAAAALEDGATKDKHVTTDSEITLPDGVTTLENYEGMTCPGDTLKAAIEYSCNTAFAELAGDLGADKLRETAKEFGIGLDDLKIPTPVATSKLGPLPSSGAVYQSGIGQADVQMTPLQVAMYTSTIANDGVAMKPHLVKELLAPDLSTVEQTNPKELTGDSALSAENAKKLTDMMEAAEDQAGGGHKRDDVDIASKTGTAEHGSTPKQTPPHGWYTAFGPTDDPKVAVAVLVENGGGQGIEATGAKVAADVGRIMIDTALGKD